MKFEKKEEKFVNMKFEVLEEVKRFENSIKQILGEIQDMNGRVESLECKTEVLNKELERQMGSLVLLELTEKEHCGLFLRLLMKIPGGKL